MFQDLQIFQMSSAMAKHAGSRQAVVATNIANADTPNFRAREIGSFRDVVQQNTALPTRTTRLGHMNLDQTRTLSQVAKFATSEPSPNGNSVSIEEEMLKSVDISREHNRALAIYRHGMTILKSAIGR